jgi:hypothetical protein
MKSAVQNANPLDLAQIGLGVVIFIASLLPYYTYSFGRGLGGSLSAWHGFFSWFAVLLTLGAVGVLVARLVAGVVIPNVRLIVAGLFGVAALFTLLSLFVVPGGGFDGFGYDTGHGFGYWLALLCSFGAAGLAGVRVGAKD